MKNREEYWASERDSRQSARESALTRRKRELLEEVGLRFSTTTHDEVSETQDSIRENFSRRTHVSGEAITHTPVLSERWDGRTLYVKARVELDVSRARQ